MVWIPVCSWEGEAEGAVGVRKFVYVEMKKRLEVLCVRKFVIWREGWCVMRKRDLCVRTFVMWREGWCAMKKKVEILCVRKVVILRKD